MFILSVFGKEVVNLIFEFFKVMLFMNRIFVG